MPASASGAASPGDRLVLSPFETAALFSLAGRWPVAGPFRTNPPLPAGLDARRVLADTALVAVDGSLTAAAADMAYVLASPASIIESTSLTPLTSSAAHLTILTRSDSPHVVVAPSDVGWELSVLPGTTEMVAVIAGHVGAIQSPPTSPGRALSLTAPAFAGLCVAADSTDGDLTAPVLAASLTDPGPLLARMRAVAPDALHPDPGVAAEHLAVIGLATRSADSSIRLTPAGRAIVGTLRSTATVADVTIDHPYDGGVWRSTSLLWVRSPSRLLLGSWEAHEGRMLLTLGQAGPLEAATAVQALVTAPSPLPTGLLEARSVAGPPAVDARPAAPGRPDPEAPPASQDQAPELGGSSPLLKMRLIAALVLMGSLFMEWFPDRARTAMESPLAFLWDRHAETQGFKLGPLLLAAGAIALVSAFVPRLARFCRFVGLAVVAAVVVFQIEVVAELAESFDNYGQAVASLFTDSFAIGPWLAMAAGVGMLIRK